MSLRYQYPWKEVSKGEGFFVPCLDTEAVRKEALIQALQQRILDARGVECIMDGLIGVWLYRTPAAPSRKTES